MPCQPAIASMSLGRAWVHELDEKFKQASDAGFKGVEIFYEDLEYLAKSYGSTNETDLLKAAAEIRRLCDVYNLSIIGLQPFWFYEGLTDRKEHEAKIERLQLWFKLVKVLKTDIIQIPANFQSTGITGDLSVIVSDMVEIADLGLQQDPVVRFAYENLAWSTYIDTWEKLWDVISRVDRPNFGCCLDTFNIAGRIWADPAHPSGKTCNADEDFRVSMARLPGLIDLRKVFYIQVVDAERLDKPLTEGHPYYVEGQPARMSWSRNCRLFLYETKLGAYMPAAEVARVLIEDMKFEGWVSMELFSKSMADPDPSVPHAHAQRGIKAWNRLAQDLHLL